jgi:thiamine pyrophosphokinase
MSKAVIICGGEIENYSYAERFIENAGYVICADGGARHARKMNAIPDVLLGDFDSISDEDYAFFKSRADIKVYPIEKDKTDSEIAVDLALEKGCGEIIILGGLGTRLDHSIANIFLLKKIHDAGARGMLADEKTRVFFVSERIRLEREEGFKISIIPIGGEARGITTTGLYYPLADEDIDYGSTRGLSNEFVADTAEITVGEGTILVIKSKD